MHWVLEPDVFGSGFSLADAARAAGHEVSLWDDAFWDTGRWPRPAGHAVFHGSLGNAARIARELPYRPGSFCAVDAFHCSAWYPHAEPWLLQKGSRLLTVAQAVAEAASLPDVFVRPDSPLKPFAGRVVPAGQMSLSALDFGFYYDDPALPVVLAPVRSIAREWRYVVVDREVVAGSAYESDGRRALPDDPDGRPFQFASEVARALTPPEPVYVLDMCESDGELYVLELNPFSGADLYACDPAAIVAAVAAHLATRVPPRSAP
ncbi:MAG: ATP-grasp domain-containing protein [Sandaracinaceae bacterium]|nr:ATP-grasp domain-containing protein [Sandaracinaceae bacterium]